jgi:outer membrane receptor for ferrienterochelin and colicin
MWISKQKFNPLMKNFLLTIVAAFTALAGFAQGNGRILGVVMDAKSKQPVEFATIALTDKDGKTVNGTIADAKGKFEIEKIANGTYTITISFIGYETITKSDLVLDGRKPELNLGTVSISEEATQLGEVVVEAKKDLVEERVDRTIYNAENDATARGGDATDVLKRVPMLSVDLDGNVSMRGSQNITVLINNKPSTVMANSIADALKQIPADQIKTVEVITSPSAKYDAEGSAGIINIITKKNTLEGLTLNVDAGVGLRGSNLGLNGNYRKGKMGFSLGGFGRANYNVIGGFENSQLTKSTDPNTNITTETLSLQTADNRSNGIFGNYNLGWDYDINKKNSVTASVRYGLRNNNSYQDQLRSTIFTNGTPNEAQSFLRDAITKDLSGTIDMNVTYTRLFEKPQQEFSLLALYSRNDRNNDFSNINYDFTTEDIVGRIRNENDGLNEEYTIQADYQTPIKDNQMFEIGVKEIRRKVLSDFAFFRATGPDGEFVQDNNQALSNQLNYNQDVLSGYMSYTYSSKSGYSLKTGARYEYTVINAFTRTDSDIDIPEYGVLVPSINASKKLKKGTIKASYNRRIQRPSIQFLNPNIQNANPLNVTIGNPSLDPEFTNNYEIGYSTFIKGTSLNLTAFVRNTNNSIQSLRTSETVAEGQAIITRYDNIGLENAYGMSFFSNLNIGKLSLNGGGDVYYADLANNVPNPEQNASNTGWVYSGRIFGGYDLGKGWGLQTFSFYRGRRVQLQGYQGGFGIYSLGARKEFTNKKGSIGFGLENFLAPSMKIKNALETPTITQSSITELRNFSVRINFSYRIGKMSFDQPRRKRSINNDDLKDGGDGGGGMDGGMGGGQGGQRGNSGGQRPATVVKPAIEVKADPAAVIVAEGNWEYSVESPQGVNGGTLKITKEGDAYNGVIVNARFNRETPIKDVKVIGNELSFIYEVSFGGNTSTILVKGVITGDQFAGNMTMGQFGSFPMTAKRTAQ